MTSKIIADKDKCVGCRICEMACSLNLEGVFNSKLSKIQVERGRKALDLPHVCFQCDDAPCAEICPTGAITRDKANGVWKISKEDCIACSNCVGVCPYGAIFMEPKENYAIKCELCEQTYCKEFCPNDALI